MDKRRVRLLSAAGVLLTAGCLILLNLVADRLYLRLDLSAGRLYSLSPGSKRILKNLNDPVEVRAYFSRDLPPQFSANRSYLEDLLKEYRSASRGKLRFRFVDVDKDAAGKQEALKQGIIPVQFNVVSSDKYEVREGLMGLILQYEDKKEVLPVLSKTETLEYELTSRLLRLRSPVRRIVGMLEARGALGPRGLNPAVREILDRNYELRSVDLSTNAVAADITTLLVLGPEEKLSERELYALDQYLLSGRGLVLGLDGQKADLSNFLVSNLDTGLPELVRHYGFDIKNGLVLDAQSQKVSVSQTRGWFTLTNIVDFPVFIVATDLSRDYPATRQMDSLNLPLANPIEVEPKLGAMVQVLARSSKHSWQRAEWNRGIYSINPLQGFSIGPKDRKGPFALAVAAQGRFESYFSTAAEAAHPLPKGADPAAFLPRSRQDSRLILIGTSRFAHPELSPEDSGPLFLMNLVDALSLDADLIAIRSKTSVFKPLMEVSPPSKATIRWANVLLPPCFVALSGVLRLNWRKRRRSRRIRDLSGGGHGAQNT